MKRISTSPLFTQHFNREKVYFLGRFSGLVGCATLGAATTEATLFTKKGTESLPGCISEREGYDSKNQKMLEPVRHVS